MLCAQTLGQMALELAVAEAAAALEDEAPAAAPDEKGPAASSSGWEQVKAAVLLEAEAADAAGVCSCRAYTALDLLLAFVVLHVCGGSCHVMPSS